MQLINFWKSLPGQWNFERVLSDQSIQIGSLNVVHEAENVYKAKEQGTYKDAQQTFFRNYMFTWGNDCLNIYGENPKEGYVLLHILSDASRKNCLSISRICTGPRKDSKLTTFYKRVEVMD